MSVCCECCVLSGRGLCDELITSPEKSCRLWCVVVCDLETSWIGGPWPTGGFRTKNKQTNNGQTSKVSVLLLENSFSYWTHDAHPQYVQANYSFPHPQNTLWQPFHIFLPSTSKFSKCLLLLTFLLKRPYKYSVSHLRATRPTHQTLCNECNINEFC